jgi:sec-independent protein translocase protein TatB
MGASVFLDLSFTKLVVLGIVALVIFGPDRLPGMAAQAGRVMRELRRMADGAKAELQDSLGPEFSQFDIADLNPRHFVRKHLGDVTGDLLGGSSDSANPAAGSGVPGWPADVATPRLSPGESPPYDAEAT